MQIEMSKQRPDGRHFGGEDHQEAGYYEFSCGHRNDKWVITTRIRRACPICQAGKLVRIHKACALCPTVMELRPQYANTKYCPACRKQYARACSVVNKKTNRSYTTAGEIDIAAALEGRDNPDVNPLDVVFKKYDADAFYRPGFGTVYRPAPCRQ